VTRVFASESPRLGGERTRLRATAWKDRVHTLELTFPDGCDARCSRALASMLGEWIGPLSEHGEGRVRFLAAEYDTTRVTLEVFPAQPHLTRVLLVCAPLERQAVGRSGRGPALRRPRWEDAARCRPLPP
jgi:16S rRNA G527 N7-methylase RsmG